MNSPDLLIFGATRNTGLHIARYACEQGLSVAAMVRNESDLNDLHKLNVGLIVGDAFSLQDCEKVFTNCQPKNIISTLGGKDKQGRRIDKVGNMNIIQSVILSKIKLDRFILMTSMGCGDQYANISEQAKEFLGEALRAKTDVENLLRTTDLPWSIIRPCGLSQEEATNQYSMITTGVITSNGYLPRADVAQAALEVLRNKQYLHQTVTIV